MSQTSYCHRWTSGEAIDLPLGKVVCVGRNYAAHAAELHNPVPKEPILFMKPATALVPMAGELAIPQGRGECHVETEIALLVNQSLSHATPDACVAAIGGVGLAYDLTLREEQAILKEKGLPWEKAKAFDGACPLSRFAQAQQIEDWSQLLITLELNGELQQRGNSEDMLNPIPHLLAYMSRYFTLQPGDVVLTGTPAGVCALNSGDRLLAGLGDGLLDDVLRVVSTIR